jgi:hypothetical protein
MLTLTLHSDTHIALRNCYAERDAIKSLAAYPDVQWNGEAKAWLIDVGLIDKLYTYLGDAIAPASVAFWCECPLPTQATYRRRTKQQIMAQKRIKQQAAAEVGSAIAENKEGMRW